MIDYDLVNSFIGRPWKYLENDCWFVVKEASLLVFGVEIIDNISFSDKPVKGDSAVLIAEQKKRPCWVKVDKFKGGDVLIFANLAGDKCHVGICIEGDNILHCLGGHDVKNGKTRYDPLNVIKLLYRNYEAYRYLC